jgi:predicted O-methyltransferase YrrM
MRSSYIENNCGEILKQNVICWRPINLVELGVLDGYSTLHIAAGLKELERLYGIVTVLNAFDLFEEYPYKHGRIEDVKNELIEAELDQYVRLSAGDAYKVWAGFEDGFIDFLHVDISNTGETIRKIMELWHPKMRERGLIFFEGGSEERDNVEWMVKYNMPSIKKELNENPIIRKHYLMGTYFKFPSMTMLLRKWGGE